jgi:putative glutamine amidotransferase
VNPVLIAVAWPNDDYRRALEKAGAVVRDLDPQRDVPADALTECAGLLLTGGEDVDPAQYGDAERHPTLELDPARDDYELALARLALERSVPVLAICRGIQVLNVAAGGTLLQDIPSQHEGAVVHDVPKTKTAMAHAVNVAPGTRLAKLLGERLTGGTVDVNSRHHQAIRRLAPGFIVSATALDGIVEAIEQPSASFCVGVQWHPENFWRTGEFAALFTGLVHAARQRRRSPSSRA